MAARKSSSSVSRGTKAEVHIHHHVHHHGPGEAAEKKGGRDAVRDEKRERDGRFDGDKRKRATRR